MKKCIDETITTGNILAGLVVKNYKLLCGLLNEKVKSGKSKTIQLKDWERFFKYERESNKFKILEVFDTPKPKERNLQGSVIVRNWIVLNELSLRLNEDEEVTEVALTTKDLFLLLGVCNEEFYNLRKIAMSKLKGKPVNLALYNKSIFTDISLNDVRSFYDEVSSRGSGLVATLVKTFNKQCGIEVKKTYSIKVNSKTRLATDDEHATIKEAESIVLSSEAYLKKVDDVLIPSSMQDIFRRRKLKPFYAELANKLDLKEIYIVYSFRFTKDILSKQAKYNQLVEGIDDPDTFLNKASIVCHLKKITPKVWKDNSKFMAIMKTKPLTQKEIDLAIKEQRIVAISQDGARGGKGYVSARKFLINELVKQFEDVEIEEKRSLKDKRDFSIPFPYFKFAA